MPTRIHVVGAAPRTGTTLMFELLVASYGIDGSAEHEMSIFDRPSGPYDVFCSKLPGDILSVGPLLRFDEHLWVINMIRDPRDVVVSRHAREPTKYWVHLGVWKRRSGAARRLVNHPRFVTVRYEDLVTDPARVQGEIEDRLPFLRRKADFKDFHKNAAPSDRAVEALGGVRPIEATSVGGWRHHKARLAAQLAAHGPIDQDLVDYGYEPDDSWLRELDGIAPDNGATFFSERESLMSRLRRGARRQLLTLRYLSAMKWAPSQPSGGA